MIRLRTIAKIVILSYPNFYRADFIVKVDRKVSKVNVRQNISLKTCFYFFPFFYCFQLSIYQRIRDTEATINQSSVLFM